MAKKVKGDKCTMAGKLLTILGLVVLLLTNILFGCSHWQERQATPYQSKATPSPQATATVMVSPVEEIVRSPTPIPVPITPTPKATATLEPTPTSTVSPVRRVTEQPTPTPTKPIATPALTGLPPARRIVIPRIEVDAEVIEVGWKVVVEGGVEKSVWEMAAFAAGHHKNSANPGERGNVVISGHHNIEGKVFRRLFELKPDDEIFLHAADGRSYRYVVTQALLLQEAGATAEERLEHARYMDPTSDATLTLISCWPYWTNTHRVVIIAKLRE